MNNNFISLIVVALIISIVMVSLFITGINKKKHRKDRQMLGIAWLRNLRVLLSYIQQHRGMSTGYLNGGVTLKNEIDSLQKKINNEITNISRLNSWMNKNSNWQSIIQHWFRLAENFKNNTAENNISQHNAMIKNIIYLIDDMAQEHGLLLLKNDKNKPLHLLWRELLPALEYIGQARAIGTGVSTAKICDSVSRIKLNYLCRKIETKSGNVSIDISTKQLQELKIKELITCINEEITKDKPTIKPDIYFRLASETLDSLYMQYDKFIDDTESFHFKN